jgi:8-oxo-dGTP pyrophosphatase MutT (NUDIX family)
VTSPSTKPTLAASDAVAALIQLADGRYVMQLRDDLPTIWYPNHWGCFGGAVDPDEAPEDALRRELREELEFEAGSFTYFTRFDFDLQVVGAGCLYRRYYVVPMSTAEFDKLVLHEGADVQALPAEKLLNELCMTPYDAFALFLYHNRARIGRT